MIMFLLVAVLVLLVLAKGLAALGVIVSGRLLFSYLQSWISSHREHRPTFEFSTTTHYSPTSSSQQPI